MSTIHNPVNFQPQDYKVIGYFDNQPPYCFDDGRTFGAIERYNQELAAWQAEGRRLFPEGNFHRCEHCGQGNVRYVVAAEHIPSGKRVCFGDICEARFEFPGHDAFAAAKIRKGAELMNARIRNYEARMAFIEGKPALKAAIIEAALPLHAGNGFVQDVLGKLEKYGSISDRQIAAVVSSLERDNEFAARRAAREAQVVAAGPAAHAPTGRVRVKGEVLNVKRYEDDRYGYGGYRITYKMLVKLASGARVFCTIPGAKDIHRGDTVDFTATFTPKAEDPTFAFGKRPMIHEWVEEAQRMQAGEILPNDSGTYATA